MFKYFAHAKKKSRVRLDLFHALIRLVSDVYLSQAVIYGVATLDVRYAATGAGEGEGESEAFKEQVGWAGSALHKFLTFPFFVTVGQWGLQLYLYQMIAYFLFQVGAFSC